MTLRQFEAVLRPLRNLYTLALELTLKREKLQPNYTYHLEREGRVDAVIDLPQRLVMLRPGTRSVDIMEATWQRRPKSANFAPEHFLRCSLPEMTWLYAMHCRAPDLPQRYLTRPIYLRSLPEVRGTLLYPRHSVLLDALVKGPLSLDQLNEEIPMAARWHERDLYALFLLRAITTSAPTNDPLAIPSISDESDGDARYLLNRMGQNLPTMYSDLEPLNLGEKNLTPE